MKTLNNKIETTTGTYTEQELLNEILRFGTIATVEKFDWFYTNSWFDEETLTLDIRTNEGTTIISLDLKGMLDYIASTYPGEYDENETAENLPSMFDRFKEDLDESAVLYINSKYQDLDEIIKDLRDEDIEEDMKEEAARWATNEGSDGCYVTYQIKMNDDFKLYLECMATEHPTKEQVSVCKIYFDDNKELLMEHNFDNDEINEYEF